MFIKSRIFSHLKPQEKLLLPPCSEVETISGKLITCPKPYRWWKEECKFEPGCTCLCAHTCLSILSPSHMPCSSWANTMTGNHQNVLFWFHGSTCFYTWVWRLEREQWPGYQSSLSAFPLFLTLEKSRYHSWLEGLSHKHSRNLKEFSIMRTFLICPDYPSKYNRSSPSLVP